MVTALKLNTRGVGCVGEPCAIRVLVNGLVPSVICNAAMSASKCFLSMTLCRVNLFIVRTKDIASTQALIADRPGVMKTSRFDDKPGANKGARTEKKKLKERNYCLKKNGDLVNGVPLALLKCSVCNSTCYW